MLVSSNCSSCSSSSRRSSSSSTSHSNTNPFEEVKPSLIVWTQTLESITLQISINHVRVLVSEQFLKFSNRSKTISLPLYDRVYIDQCDIEEMLITSNKIMKPSSISLTLEKECFGIWPHLFLQEADNEIEKRLLEATFLIHIKQEVSSDTLLLEYDTLDFETVINGHGERTGLE